MRRLKTHQADVTVLRAHRGAQGIREALRKKGLAVARARSSGGALVSSGVQGDREPSLLRALGEGSLC